MAKPPRKIPSSSTSPDGSTLPTRSTAAQGPDAIAAVSGPGSSRQTRAPGTDERAVETTASETPRESAVVVNPLPGATPERVAAAMAMITLRPEQVAALRAIDNEPGLFRSEDSRTYAHLGDGTYFLAVRNAAGEYQVPLLATPHLSGPTLRRIDGQALWRIEAPDWMRAPPSDSSPSAGAPARPATPLFLSRQLAETLTHPDDSSLGLRFDRKKRTYVDMQGPQPANSNLSNTVQVRRNSDGIYQQCHAGERTPSGPLVEQIPGTRLWRETPRPTTAEQTHSRPDVDQRAVRPDSPEPGPSKRPRLEADERLTPDTDLFADRLLLDASGAMNLSTGYWRNWGKTQKPADASIEIAGLHYPIVPQPLQANPRLVYLQHPRFAPDRFDAFERMLVEEPALQPIWAVKRESGWAVMENRMPFATPLTQQVANAFNYMAPDSASAIAREVFRRAAYQRAIDGNGLARLNQTFRHWNDRAKTFSPRRDLSDPLMMLPTLPTLFGVTAPHWRIHLPTRTASEYQRLNFDPTRLPEWSAYMAAPDSANLQTLFRTVLQHNGYSLYASSRALNENAVVFHREGLDAVFVLKIPDDPHNLLHRATLPGFEIANPQFRAVVGEAAHQRLISFVSEMKIIYLVGGLELTGVSPALYIVRES